MSRRFWSNVFAIGFKEARALRNDPATIVMMLVQPVIMVLLYGGVIQNTPRHVPWGVIDRDQARAPVGADHPTEAPGLGGRNGRARSRVLHDRLAVCN